MDFGTEVRLVLGLGRRGLGLMIGEVELGLSSGGESLDLGLVLGLGWVLTLQEVRLGWLYRSTLSIFP